MISPRAKVIWLVALLVVPASALLAVLPALVPAGFVLFFALILACAADVFFFRPDFSTLRLTIPELVRLNKDRDGLIEVKIANKGQAPVRLQIGFRWPAEIGAATDRIELLALPGTVKLFPVGCRPVSRGRFEMHECYVRAATRFGLWNVRQRLPLQTEIRVYPDLLADRRRISALFLRHGFLGFRQYRQVGKGREFEKLRDYIAGDGMDDIHWKATAKRGRPVTKVFQIERTQEVYVIVDTSRLSGRWSGGATMVERYLTSALILCLAAARQGDLFGVVTFSDKLQNFVRARNGKAHYDVCRDVLYNLQPQAVSPDFQELFTFLRLRLRRRALLIFLTALDDPALAEGFVEHVDLLTRQHVVFVNLVRPPEARPLFASGEATYLDQIYQRLGGHLLWKELQEIKKKLHARGAESSLLTADDLAAEAINSYLRIKQRQLV